MNLPVLPNMPWGQDKSWHLIVGLLGGAGTVLVARYLGSTHAWLWALGAGVLVGTGKEAWDWWQNRKASKAGLVPPHSVELWDAIATTIGFAVGGLALIVL